MHQEVVNIKQEEAAKLGYYNRDHDEEGLLSFSFRSSHSTSPNFSITLRPTPHLDNNNIVFGKVVRGYEIIKSLENTKSDSNDKPISSIRIINSGELELKLPPNVKRIHIFNQILVVYPETNKKSSRSSTEVKKYKNK